MAVGHLTVMVIVNHNDDFLDVLNLEHLKHSKTLQKRLVWNIRCTSMCLFSMKAKLN